MCHVSGSLVKLTDDLLTGHIMAEVLSLNSRTELNCHKETQTLTHTQSLPRGNEGYSIGSF